MKQRKRLKMRWYLCWLGIALATLVMNGCREIAQVTGQEERLQQSGLFPQAQDETPEAPAALLATGTIQSDEVRIASELGGRIAQVQVRSGQQVQAGELLVTLDSTPLLAELAKAEAAVASAEAELAIIRAGTRPEQIGAQRAALALAEAQLDGARAAWENALEAVENPQELNARIVEARTKVELAAQNVELAEAQLAAEQLLRNQRPENSAQRQIADLQVKAAEDAVAAAQADEKAAQTLLNWLYVIHNEPLNLITRANVAQGHYEMAQAGLAVAQAQLADLLAGPTPEEVATAEAAVALSQAKADVLRTQQGSYGISSPIDGLVLDQVLYAGEVAAPAATIITVSELQSLSLVVYVPQNRIGEVVLGQPVQVTVDGLSGETFLGEVTRIGSEPEFTPRNVTTAEERMNTYFVVEIGLSDEEDRLKPGMLADALFLEADNAAAAVSQHNSVRR